MGGQRFGPSGTDGDRERETRAGRLGETGGASREHPPPGWSRYRVPGCGARGWRAEPQGAAGSPRSWQHSAALPELRVTARSEWVTEIRG